MASPPGPYYPHRPQGSVAGTSQMSPPFFASSVRAPLPGQFLRHHRPQMAPVSSPSLPSAEHQQQRQQCGRLATEAEKNDLYTCVKCRTIFLAGGRSKPKLLPCLHVICVTCLTGEANNALRSVCCPACRFVSRSDETVDHVIPEVSGGPGDLKCQASNCPDRGIAIVFCEHCNEALCTGCMTAHKRVTATRNHSLREYCNRGNFTAPKMLCPSHPNDMLHYFCQNCQKVTCSTCQASEHQGHGFLTIQEAARIEKERFQELVLKNNKRLLNLRSSKHVVQQRLDEVDKAEKDLRVQLRTTIVQLQDVITQRGSQLLADIVRGARDKREQYLKNKEDVEKITGMLEQAQSIAEEVLKTKVLEFYPNHMLEIKRMLSRHLERVREVKFDMNSLQQPIQMNLNIIGAAEIKDRLAHFGQVQVRGQIPVAPQATLVAHSGNPVAQEPPRMVMAPNTTPTTSSQMASQQRMAPPPNPSHLVHRGPMSPPQRGLGVVPQQFGQNTQQRSSNGLPPGQPPVSMAPQHRMMMIQQRLPNSSHMMQMQPGQMPMDSAQRLRSPPGLMQQAGCLQDLLRGTPGYAHGVRGPPPMLQQAPHGAPQRPLNTGVPLPRLFRYITPPSGVNQQSAQNSVNAETLVRNVLGQGEEIRQPVGYANPNDHQFNERGKDTSKEVGSGYPAERMISAIEDVQVVNDAAADKEGIVPKPVESVPYNASSSSRLFPVSARKSISKAKSLADVVSSLNQRGSASNSPALDATTNNEGWPTESDKRPGISHSPGSLRLTLSKRQDGRYSPITVSHASEGQHLRDIDATSLNEELENGRNRRDTPDASLVTTTSQNSKESDDWCAVCQNGCDESDPQDLLLVCDGKECPRVFHKGCHVPEVKEIPPDNEEWLCTFCLNAETLRTDLDNLKDGKRVRREFLTDYERKLCQKLLLELCCNPNGVEFHAPVAKKVKDYYEIIKRPVDLYMVARRLDLTKRPYAKNYYRSVRAFIDDLNRMFRNCSRYNTPDSEVAIAGRDLWNVYKNLVEAYFPDLLEFVWNHESLYVNVEEVIRGLPSEHTPSSLHDELAGPSAKRSRFGDVYYSSGDEMDHDDFDIKQDT